MEEDYIKADKSFNRKFITLLAVAIPTLYYLFVHVLHPYLNSLKVSMDMGDDAVMSEISAVFKAMIFIFWFITVSFGMYIIKYSSDIIRSEQLPPPGARVIKDKKITKGKKAVAFGKMSKYLGIFVIIFSSVTCIAMYYVLFEYLGKGNV